MYEAKKKVYEIVADSSRPAYEGRDLEMGGDYSIEFFSFNAVVDYAKQNEMEAVLVSYAPPTPLYFEI